jgi:hypothetical protein
MAGLEIRLFARGDVLGMNHPTLAAVGQHGLLKLSLGKM